MKNLDRRARAGETRENFEQRFQRTLDQRLAPLGDDAGRALDAVNILMSRIGDSAKQDNVKSDLVFRVFERVIDIDDFRDRFISYAQELERRKVTMNGEPIFSDSTS